MSVQEFDIDLNEILYEWKDQEGNLIMVLHQIQKRLGYVPRELSLQIAKALDVPLARIYEVITFYHFFKLEKPGDHVISLCNGTACYLKGIKRLQEALSEKLNIQPGETTSDRKFHLQEVRCLGCCSLSPVVMVDAKVYADLTVERIPELIEDALHGKVGATDS